MVLTLLLIILIIAFGLIAVRANRRRDMAFLFVSGLASIGFFFLLLWHLFATR